jgi:hypothetical protein
MLGLEMSVTTPLAYGNFLVLHLMWQTKPTNHQQEPNIRTTTTKRHTTETVWTTSTVQTYISKIYH